MFFAVLEAVEHFEDGEIRLRSCQPFRAATSPDPHHFAAILEQLDERIEHRCFPEASFRRQQHHSPLAPFGTLELVEQRVHFQIAADYRARGSLRPVCDRDRGQCRGDGGVMRQPQSIEHFPGAGSQAGVFLQRFADQLIERPRNFRVDE